MTLGSRISKEHLDRMAAILRFEASIVMRNETHCGKFLAAIMVVLIEIDTENTAK
jgi:hypothetical protein